MTFGEHCPVYSKPIEPPQERQRPPYASSTVTARDFRKPQQQQQQQQQRRPPFNSSTVTADFREKQPQIQQLFKQQQLQLLQQEQPKKPQQKLQQSITPFLSQLPSPAATPSQDSLTVYDKLSLSSLTTPGDNVNKEQVYRLCIFFLLGMNYKYSKLEIMICRCFDLL